MKEKKKGLQIFNNGIDERHFKPGQIPNGYLPGRLKENTLYLYKPCTEEKSLKISKSRKNTLEKYKNMSEEEFIIWIKEIEKRGTLWRKKTFGSNITRAIISRGESIEEYQKIFPKIK